jgi:hypothetical protein
MVLHLGNQFNILIIPGSERLHRAEQDSRRSNPRGHSGAALQEQRPACALGEGYERGGTEEAYCC